MVGSSVPEHIAPGPGRRSFPGPPLPSYEDAVTAPAPANEVSLDRVAAVPLDRVAACLPATMTSLLRVPSIVSLPLVPTIVALLPKQRPRQRRERGEAAAPSMRHARTVIRRRGFLPGTAIIGLSSGRQSHRAQRREVAKVSRALALVDRHLLQDHVLAGAVLSPRGDVGDRVDHIRPSVTSPKIVCAGC